MSEAMTSQSRGLAARSLRWVVILRFLAILAGFIVVLVHAENLVRPGGFSDFREAFLESRILFIFLGIVAVLNGICLAVSARVRSPERFVLTQLGADTFLLAALIYLTGGPGSIFTHFYVAVILASSILGSARSSFVFASLSATLLAVIAVLFVGLDAGPPPGVPRSWFTERRADIAYFVSGLGIPALAFFLVAVLGNSLAVRFRTLRLVNDRVLRTMAEAVVICDRQQHIILFNREARRLFGFPPDAVLEGLAIQAVFKRESDTELCAVLSTLEDIRKEVSLVRRTGEVVPLECRTSVVSDYRGSPIAAICLLNDLTHRRTAEEAERKIERLEGIREMAAGIAQELRQLTVAIQASLADLQAAGRVIQKADPRWTDLRDNLARLEGILAEFVEFSRKEKLTFIEVDIVQLVRDALEMVENRVVRLDRYDLQLALPNSLPAHCDPEQIRRVVYHIVLNAVEAMPEGGRVLIRGRKQTRESLAEQILVDGICLEFYDQGPGIPAEAQDKIMTPFYGTKKRGAGLGLSIANRIVRAHGGEISFESRVGFGTTFMVWLPSNPRPQGPEPEPAAARNVPGQPEPGPKTT